jgi:hypothetical protein
MIAALVFTALGCLAICAGATFLHILGKEDTGRHVLRDADDAADDAWADALADDSGDWLTAPVQPGELAPFPGDDRLDRLAAYFDVTPGDYLDGREDDATHDLALPEPPRPLPSEPPQAGTGAALPCIPLSPASPVYVVLDGLTPHEYVRRLFAQAGA